MSTSNVASIAATGTTPASGSERPTVRRAEPPARLGTPSARRGARHGGAIRAAIAIPAPETLLSRDRDRDLGDSETWELSLGRSRARRRAAQLRFVPARSRAKRISLGTLVAMAAAPVASLGDGSAAPALASTKTVPTTTTTKHEILLRNGSSGRQVRLLQQALGVKVDGSFGAETEAAVISFQRSHRLEADGVVGPQTKAALSQGSLETIGNVATIASVGREGASETAGDATGAEGEGGSTEGSEAEGGEAASAEGAKASATEAAGSESESALASDVKALQGALHIKADGIFGPETENAVIRYQKELKLHVDGIVGPETWGALGYKGRADLYPPASAAPASLPREASGSGSGSTATATIADTSAAATRSAAEGESAVRVLQEALGISVDGSFGPQTLAAVKRYQSEHHLEVDGIVGPATWAALGHSGMKQLSEAHAWVLASQPHR
ncbi:MAG: peptidoglycan-binding domain-containing protein, partial [Solirubrobacteraceae bacterium]